MSAGRLQKKIEIQQSTQTQDAYGGIVDTWSRYATVWAEVTPLSGREYWDAQQVNPELTVKFRTRWLSGVLPTMRISYDARTFDIHTIVDLEERHRWLIFLCTERVQVGT